MSRTILIVEDCPEEREIFSKYLGFAGGRTIQATNGEEGLRMARENRPDLMLLDLSMPVMDGWEVIRQLREDPQLARIPVIAVTAHHLTRESLKEVGFRGYLEKPLAPYRLLEEVERCLGRIDEGGEGPDSRSSGNQVRRKM